MVTIQLQGQHTAKHFHNNGQFIFSTSHNMGVCLDSGVSQTAGSPSPPTQPEIIHFILSLIQRQRIITSVTVIGSLILMRK